VGEDDERQDVTWSIGPIESLPQNGANAPAPPTVDDRTPWRATLLASVAALAIAVLALVLSVSTGSNHGLSCPEAWRTFDESTLPAGWTLTRSEYNVIGASFAFAGSNAEVDPATPSISPSLQVNVICAGPGSERLFDVQRRVRPTGSAAPTEVDIGDVGERRMAVALDDGDSQVQVLRGHLMAQFFVQGTDVDQPDLLAIYRAVDEFMKDQ
jgi:hypothetical protein